MSRKRSSALGNSVVALTKSISKKRAVVVAGSASLALLSPLVASANNTWDGGAGSPFNWTNNVNWGADTATTYGTLTFTGTIGTTNTLDASFNENQISWQGAGPWTLNSSGGAVLNLFDNGGTQAKLENSSSGLVTINAPVTFAATTGANFGEINAINGSMTFATNTLTVNGSAVAGIKMFGTGNTTTFNSTVSASGKYFATSATNKIAAVGATFTASEFYVMNGGTLNLNSGGTLNANVRLGGDFGTTGTQNLALSGTFNLTNTVGGQTFANVVNSVGSNTSGALVVNSQNTSGTNTLSGHLALDSNLSITQSSGGTLNITQVRSTPSDTTTGTDIKGLTLTFNSSGTVAVSGTIYNSTGTGAIVKSGAGTLTLSNANTYGGSTSVNAGTLRVTNTTGSATGTGNITVASGATLTGTGSVSGSVSLTGTVSPGASPGTLNTGAQTWNGGGHYTFEVDQVTTGAGSQATLKGTDPGADFLNITGGLTLTGLSSGNKFNIDVTGLLHSSHAAGAVTNWNGNKSYNWTIATASGGISGFSAGNFAINTGGFTSNNTAPGTWSISQATNDLVLNYLAPNTISLTATATNTNVADNTNASENPGATTAGSVHVTGTGSGFQSEVDGLTSNVNTGSANIDNDLGGNTPVYVMLWTSGTLSSTLIPTNGTLITSGSVFTDLQNVYGAGGIAGTNFNYLVQFSTNSFTGGVGAVNWSFASDAGVTLDRIAVVPEPATAAAGLMLGTAALVSRRRRLKI